MSLRLLSGLGEVAPRYDGLILDLWGVLHDGTRPFPGAIDALQHLRRAGKRICVLSNAPRRAAAVERGMNRLGIAPGLYDHVHSSGEETWQHLARRDDPFYVALGRRCYHIGPPREADLVEGLGIDRVAEIDAADFILNSGPWGVDATVETYEPVLAAGVAHGLPMICANPDLVVTFGGRRVVCAGSLARRYEALGGRVRWHGKPFPSVYATCFEHLGIADRQRILAVGDSLHTDIAGANGVGIDALLVAGGIHREEFGLATGEMPDAARVAAAIAASGHTPLAVVARFVW